MIPTINGLVAAWIETLRPDQTAAAWQVLMKLKDGSRRYLHDGEGTAFADLGWKALTIVRDGPFVDFDFHHDDILFATECRSELMIVVLHRRIPLTVLSAWQSDASTILGGSNIDIPALTLHDSSTDKGVTSLVLQVPNKRIE
ncbi:hypothetical protein [Qipengyuania spongiae]|uniref:Uncharacterized protein n=1 Tax=Qipengyuania spongiae TaxID=2909673 RepID=A0ABY5T0C6_9SPHN|nr:hypothetical protein [Qipengyuania spongiae]UVI38374.1 hypothetical protein L1F33_08875 [Qipengyuania spongiae]